MLEYLHRKSISCALIQETHLKQSDVARFQNKYYKLAAFSSAQNKTKGVLILVNRKLNLMIEHHGSDEKGRFVFIRCKIYNNRLALVSIYGPNETDSAFLTQISKTLLEESDCPLVVGRAARFWINWESQFFFSNRDHDSELNKIMCDKIWIAAVYLKVFNLNELLNILIYNTVWPGFTDGA